MQIERIGTDFLSVKSGKSLIVFRRNDDGKSEFGTEVDAVSGSLEPQDCGGIE
jgi:hypothetical protein